MHSLVDGVSFRNPWIVPIFRTLFYLLYTKFALNISIVIIFYKTYSDILYNL